MKYSLIFALVMILISSSSFAEEQAKRSRPFPYGPLCCAAKGEVDDSRIMFVDVYGKSGVFSIDVETKEIKEVFIKSGKYFSIDWLSLFSVRGGLYLTYLHCQDKSNCFNYLSFINHKYEEEVLLKSKYPSEIYHSPVPSPDNNYVAIIKSKPDAGTSDWQSHVLILNQKKTMNNVLDVSYISGAPNFEVMYLWNNDSDRLYVIATKDNETTFYVYHVDHAKLMTLAKMDSINIFYAYPFPVNNRYILFLTKEKSAQGSFIGKFDIVNATMEIKNINDGDMANHDQVIMPLYPFMSKLPEEKYFVIAGHKDLKSNIFYVFDQELKIVNRYHDKGGKKVSPIGYNKILGKALLFSDRELINFNYGDKPSIETIHEW